LLCLTVIDVQRLESASKLEHVRTDNADFVREGLGVPLAYTLVNEHTYATHLNGIQRSICVQGLCAPIKF